MKIKVLIKVVTTWFKVGWPVCVKLVSIVVDGTITRKEVSEAVDLLFGDNTEIVLWK